MPRVTPRLPSSRFAPDVRVDETLERERLLQYLDRSHRSAARFTVLRAPAGFGKTTLYAQWARRLKTTGVATAWLNCAAEDASPNLPGLIADALRHAGLSGDAHERDSLAACLLAARRQTGRLALFIDNYEWQASVESDTLLAEIARDIPEGVHIYLTGRRVPDTYQHQQRLAGYLRMIDAAMLSFTDEEAAALLGPTVSPDTIASLTQQCDGWPVALASARLRIASESDSVRNDEAADALIYGGGLPDYLTRQVLDGLAPREQHFLIETAILDTIDANIADAVREKADSAQCLRALNVLAPLVQSDPGGPRVRINRLLRQILLNNARSEGERFLTQAHLRAATAYAAHNDLLGAVSHAVAGGRPDIAADAIEARGACRLIADLGLGRTRKLLAQLPGPLRHARPRLRLLHIAHLLVEDHAEEARWDLERLQRDLREASPGSLQARLAADDEFGLELAFIESLVLVNRAEHELILSPWEELERVNRLASVRFCEDWRLLGLSIPLQILFLHRYGPLSDASRYITRIEHVYRSEASEYNIAWVRFNRARECVGSGQLDEATRLLDIGRDTQQDVFRFQQRSFSNMLDALRAQVAYLKGDLSEATVILDGIEPEPNGSLLEISTAVYIDQARCHRALGDETRAHACLDEGVRLARLENLPHLALLCQCVRIEWLADSGSRAATQALSDQIDLPALWNMASVPRALPWVDVEAIGRANIALALLNHRQADARQMADQLLELAERSEDQPAILRQWLLKCRVLRHEPNAADARAALTSAVTLAAASGISQPFVDENIDPQWLEDLGGADDPRRNALFDSVKAAHLRALQMRLGRDARLTQRERDVMIWLAQSCTTKEIGRKLDVSPETVKQHLKAIFQKLQVNSRQDAVAIYRP
ncbi:ATP-, maltotriose- and DNA-dependent transcriptional regulator MalT [Burkholderia sp. OK233]|nr:ATP-, maltotriose- and DNA-dependent transcriptional regulator MalT [Burkholderia sp. OK233]